jgi:hypothetical protein
VLDFVSRQGAADARSFRDAFPAGTPAAVIVDTLFANAGITPTVDERLALVNQLAASPDSPQTRAAVLKAVADNPRLQQQERSRAFVLMQYFGYLRRNPDDAPEANRDFAGYNFWLGKLDQFGGDFRRAEMVRAFISSDEYRNRFK